MTSALSRRGFLGRTAATGLGIAFAGSTTAISGTAANAAVRSSAGYGPLVTDPKGILSLPQGFSYKIIATAGQTRMEDGNLTPTDMDGVGVFASATGSTPDARSATTWTAHGPAQSAANRATRTSL